jgi:hypothetical protein
MSDKYLTRDHRKYDLIIPGSIYEIEVQSIVERNIPSLFPGHIGKIVEPYFSTSAGDVKPDIVIIKLDYSSWGIVEVESEVHSFSAHILPQLAKMSYARSDERSIKTILDAFKDILNLDNLLSVLERKPEAYLAMHGSSEKYLDNLKEINIHSLDFQIHKQHFGDYILEVNDFRSHYESESFIVRRTKSPLFRNLWAVESGAPQFPDDMTEIRITLEGQTSTWGMTSLNSGVIFRSPAELPIPETLEIVKAYRQRDGWGLKWEKVNE